MLWRTLFALQTHRSDNTSLNGWITKCWQAIFLASYVCKNYTTFDYIDFLTWPPDRQQDSKLFIHSAPISYLNFLLFLTHFCSFELSRSEIWPQCADLSQIKSHWSTMSFVHVVHVRRQRFITVVGLRVMYPFKLIHVWDAFIAGFSCTMAVASSMGSPPGQANSCCRVYKIVVAKSVEDGLF